MSKQFLANQVTFVRFALNPPEFSIKLRGRIDGEEEDRIMMFKDEDGTRESLLIVRQILDLLHESYANATAVGLVGSKKLYRITVPLDDEGTKIIPPVDINSKSPEQLAAIHGIGAKLADGIIEKQPFKSVYDLTTVKGIGGKLLASIRPSIFVEEPPAPTE